MDFHLLKARVRLVGIKNPAASERGMENVLLPNSRFGLQSDFLAASDGESTRTRLKQRYVLLPLSDDLILSASETASHVSIFLVAF